MKKIKGILAVILCVTMMVSVTGCKKHPKKEDSLIRYAKSVSYEDLDVIDYTYDDGEGRDHGSKIVVEDGEYGFEYEVESHVGDVGGIDGGSFFNPFTNDTVKKVYVEDNFHQKYISHFFKYCKKDIEKLEKKYGVEIPKPNYKSPQVQYFIIVFNCPDEDVADDVFEKLSELLEEYDSRGYFKKTEKEGKTTSAGYRICFCSDEFDDSRTKKGIYIPEDNADNFFEAYDLDPEKWD